LLHHYRVTKYDPALRNESGAYTGDDWTMFSQIGEVFGGARLTLAAYLEVEEQHLVALASFLEESGTSSVTAEDVENNPDDAFRVAEGASYRPLRLSRPSARCLEPKAGAA
jgi:hypothetical protein